MSEFFSHPFFFLYQSLSLQLHYFLESCLYGSAIEETAWHIYKAEIKDGRARITITLDQMDWYRPAMQAYTYMPAASGSYSILECPPYKNYENKDEHVRKGHVFYYAVSNLVGLMQATETALSEAPAYKVDDNW